MRGLSEGVKEAVGRLLVEDAKDFYKRAVKRSIVEYRRLDAYEEARMRVLRVPDKRAQPAAPAMGMLPLTADADNEAGPDVAFPDLLYWGRNMMFYASPLVLSALATLHTISLAIGDQMLWCLSPITSPLRIAMEMEELAALAVGLDDLLGAGAPYEPDVLHSMQATHLARVQAFIDVKLGEAFGTITAPDLMDLLAGGAEPTQVRRCSRCFLHLVAHSDLTLLPPGCLVLPTPAASGLLAAHAQKAMALMRRGRCNPFPSPHPSPPLSPPRAGASWRGRRV